MRRRIRKTTTVYNIIDVLIASLKVIEERGGYVSQKTASVTGEPATSHFVIQYLKNLVTLENSQGIIPEDITQKYIQKAIEIQSYYSVYPINQIDDFLIQVYNLISTNMMSERMVGFIVALPNMYENICSRTIKLQSLAQKYHSSNYMGTVGIRETFLVKLIDVSEHKSKDEGQENPGEIYYLYKVSDRMGNLGFFFSKNDLLIKLWSCFDLTATVKKQEPNKDTGIKETQFSMVSVGDIIGQGTEE